MTAQANENPVRTEDSGDGYEAPRIEESAEFETLALSCQLQPGLCEPFPTTNS